MIVISMGDRGSKSDLITINFVKEQRVDGSSVIKNKALKPILTVRCTLVAEKSVFKLNYKL